MSNELYRDNEYKIQSEKQLKFLEDTISSITGKKAETGPVIGYVIKYLLLRLMRIEEHVGLDWKI